MLPSITDFQPYSNKNTKRKFGIRDAASRSHTCLITSVSVSFFYPKVLLQVFAFAP